jgi:hypothetical protein
MEKRQNCNGKRKKPLLVAELLQLFLIKKNLSLPDETRGRETKAPKLDVFDRKHRKNLWKRLN